MNEIPDLSRETPAVQMLSIEVAVISIVAAASLRALLAKATSPENHIADILALGIKQLSEQMPGGVLRDVATARLREVMAEMMPTGGISH